MNTSTCMFSALVKVMWLLGEKKVPSMLPGQFLDLSSPRFLIMYQNSAEKTGTVRDTHGLFLIFISYAKGLTATQKHLQYIRCCKSPRHN